MRKIIEKLNQVKYIKNFKDILLKPEIRVLPGSIAFFLVMSIVPTLLLIAVICSRMSIPLTDIVLQFSEIIPDEVHQLLLSVLADMKVDNLSIWYIVLGIFLASNGTHSIILASNTLYGVENKSYLNRRIKALVMILVMSIVFVFIIFAIAFGNHILKFILSLKIFSDVSVKVYSIFIVFKWPVAILVIALLIKILYTLAPDTKVASKYVNKGVIFTTVGWVISTAIYSYYANHLANYSLIYGGLSSIVVLMIWINVISYILVLGIAINTNHYALENEKRE